MSRNSQIGLASRRALTLRRQSAEHKNLLQYRQRRAQETPRRRSLRSNCRLEEKINFLYVSSLNINPDSDSSTSDDDSEAIADQVEKPGPPDEGVGEPNVPNSSVEDTENMEDLADQANHPESPQAIPVAIADQEDFGSSDREVGYLKDPANDPGPAHDDLEDSEDSEELADQARASNFPIAEPSAITEQNDFGASEKDAKGLNVPSRDPDSIFEGSEDLAIQIRESDLSASESVTSVGDKVSETICEDHSDTDFQPVVNEEPVEEIGPVVDHLSESSGSDDPLPICATPSTWVCGSRAVYYDAYAPPFGEHPISGRISTVVIGQRVDPGDLPGQNFWIIQADNSRIRPHPDDVPSFEQDFLYQDPSFWIENGDHHQHYF